MNVFRYLCSGDWLPSMVECRWRESTFSPPAEVAELIESAWSEAQRNPGVTLFDGPLCRLESFIAEPAHLKLNVSRTSYKVFVGTNLSHPEVADRFGANCLANAMGISCAVISADDFLLLGRRNSRVAYYPNRIHPFAGALEPADPLDIFEEARRELAEELNFTSQDIAEMRCLGLVEDQALRQPELVCQVRSTKSRIEIERNLEIAEHENALAIPLTPDRLRAVLQSEPLLTPVAQAAIQLTAHHLFPNDSIPLVQQL